MMNRVACLLLLSLPLLAQDVQLGLDREQPRSLQINPPGGFLRLDSRPSEAWSLRVSWDLWHPRPEQALEIGAGLRAPSERQLTYRNSTGASGDVQARLRLDWQPELGLLYRFEHPFTLPLEVGFGLEARQERLVMKDGGLDSPGTLHRAWARVVVRHRFRPDGRGPFLSLEVARPLTSAPTPSGLDYLADLDHLGSSSNPGTAATAHAPTLSWTVAVGWRFGRRVSESPALVPPRVQEEAPTARPAPPPTPRMASAAPRLPASLPPTSAAASTDVPRPEAHPAPRASVPAGEVILHFAIDQSEVPAQGREALAAWIARVKGLGAPAEVSVSGYADATGQARHNRWLSRARAKAVARILRHEGVGVASVRGFGSRQPVAANRTPRGRALNRRVAVHLDAPVSEVQGVEDSEPVLSRRAAHATPAAPKTRSAR